MERPKQEVSPIVAIEVALSSDGPGEVGLSIKLKQVREDVFAGDDLDFLHAALPAITALVKSQPDTPINKILEAWADEMLDPIYH